MEADDVVRQQPLVDLLADLRGQHAPGVRLRPRDVHEVVQERVRARPPDHARQRVELVVVDHHDRLVAAVDLLEHRLGEVLVDDVVAELERLDLVPADVRRVALVPQVVLDEPEHRVGEDVVEAVVGLGVGGDEAHAELAAVGASISNGAPPCSLGHLDVAVGHSRRDPHRVAVRCEPDQRGREPAGAALDRSVVLVGDRPAVGDEDERCAVVGIGSSTSPMISRGSRAGSAGSGSGADDAPCRAGRACVRAPGPRGCRARSPRILDGGDEIAATPVLDLERDPADVAADERPALPSASETVSPKPSRVDFWITTSASDWKALTSIAPTLEKLLRMWMSGVAVRVRQRRVVEVPALGVVGRHRADERELHVGRSALTSR